MQTKLGGAGIDLSSTLALVWNAKGEARGQAYCYSDGIIIKLQSAACKGKASNQSPL